jgi:succinate dehydrogenase / fumarate reductase membrane anchor subunit
VVNRVVVGARYGLRDWLAQRITGALIALYALFLAAWLLASPRPVDYAAWKGLFASGWMRVATLLLAVSLVWHAWVGVRDILMDYIKPAGIRLALQVGVLLTLAAYLGWTVQILWR